MHPVGRYQIYDFFRRSGKVGQLRSYVFFRLSYPEASRKDALCCYAPSGLNVYMWLVAALNPPLWLEGIVLLEQNKTSY